MGGYAGSPSSLPSPVMVGSEMQLQSGGGLGVINETNGAAQIRMQIASSSKFIIDSASVNSQVGHNFMGNIAHFGSGLGFYGTTPAAKATITGAKASNAALASLLNALSVMGLVTDSTSA